MKKFHNLIAIVLAFTLMTFITGCGGGGSSTPTGTLSLSITDAQPQLDKDENTKVTEVNIAVIGIEYNYEGNWITAEDFVPQTFNLFELHSGKSLHLGDMILPAGHYQEIRFKLAAPTKESEVKSNPDCNITWYDEVAQTVISEPLFVPSGGQSGYKGKGAFDITADAKIEVTADFDIYKSIVPTGSGKYILKPVIRLVVTELSGMIKGTVVDAGEEKYASSSLMVFSYKSDFNLDVTAEKDNNFPNAVSSDDVNMSDGNFTLAYLGEGNYTLVAAEYQGDVLPAITAGVVAENVEVLKGQTTLVDINTTNKMN